MDTEVTYIPETPIKLETAYTEANLATKLDEDFIGRLGHKVIEDYKRDKESRYEWELRHEQAMKLALQIFEEKTWPWPKAASVKFPLITIAALQYHARAYPALVSPNDVVKYQVFGPDPGGKRDALGEKIAEHMNWQLTEQDERWEEHTDKALMVQPILGCVFKKSYYSGIAGHNVSELIFPSDLVVDYFTTSLETAYRISHVLPPMSGNDIYERVQRGLFLDVDLGMETPSEEVDRAQAVRDKREGLHDTNTADRDRPYKFIEQHCWLDLDDDGYQEPYIVTVHEQSRKLVRIVSRFGKDDVELAGGDHGRVLRIVPQHYFTKIPFIPSPDGGFYDIGFGTLLSPLNESINTLINQLIDAGTLANLGGGFLGRGFKSKSGNTMFTPGEWKRGDFAGDDIGKAIFPIPTPPPSPVLFQMLDLLINYGERTGGSVDLQVGVTPGQNTPAETSRAAMESGLKVFGGIFKRTYRAFKEEFRKLYMLNRRNLPELADNPFGVTFKDYMADPKGIRPAADPNIMSDQQRLYQAEAMRTASREGPGWNLFAVQRRYAKALKVTNVDEVLPVDPKTGGPAVEPPPNPKVLAEQTKQGALQLKGAELQWKVKSGTAKLLQEAEKTEAQIKELEARAMKHRADAKTDADNHQLALVNTELAISKEKHAGILNAIKILNEVGASIHEQHAGAEGVGAGAADKGVPGPAAGAA